MMMMMEEGEISPDSPKRKDLPMEMPLTPLPAMPSLGLDNTADDTGNSKQELDVLYPTADNVFATQTSGNNNGNGGGGNLLSSYPLLHMQDYTASINDVARAIPTPQGSPIQSKKARATVWPPTPSLNEDPRAPSIWPPPPPLSPPARHEATLPASTSPEPTWPTQGASSTKFPSVPNTRKCRAFFVVLCSSFMMHKILPSAHLSSSLTRILSFPLSLSHGQLPVFLWRSQGSLGCDSLLTRSNQPIQTTDSGFDSESTDKTSSLARLFLGKWW